jgi:hypothetical protein
MDFKTLKETPPWEWPSDAGKTFLRVLRNLRAVEGDRLLAAEMMGDSTVINDELVEALLTVLEDEKESVELRGQAAISLGPALEEAHMYGFEDPDDVPISEEVAEKIQGTLRKLHRDTKANKEVRRRALEAAVRSPQEWHRDAVLSAYNSKDEDWKLTAVFCMGYIRGFEKQIIESLGNRVPDIKREAISAAGNWELSAAWPRIVSLLTSKDTEKSILLAAIDAAPGIRPDEAMEVLEKLLKSDDEEIVEAAQEAMSMAGAMIDYEYEEEDEDGGGKTYH